MLTPELEKYILRNEAVMRRVTHGFSAEYVIPTPENKTNVITCIDVAPFIVMNERLRIVLNGSNPYTLTDFLDLWLNQNNKGVSLVDIFEALFQACTLQIQVKVPSVTTFNFILRPTMELNAKILKDSTDQNYNFGGMSLRYERQKFDTYIVFDRDIYISVNRIDANARLTINAASVLVKGNVPALKAPYSLKDDDNADSMLEIYQNFNSVADPLLKSYLPMPEKYITSSINPDILLVKSEGIEFYNVPGGGGSGEPSYSTESNNIVTTNLHLANGLLMDFDIVSINSASVLRK